MKKLLLVPTVLFPYSVCACLAYGFISGNFSGDPMITYLAIFCLACFVLAFICNIIFMILARNEDPKTLVKASLVLKIIHLPTYTAIFILGVFMGMMFLMTFPFIIFLVFIDCATMILSGMISVFSLIKNIGKNTLLSVIAILLQFIFCADVISLLVLNCITKKQDRISSAQSRM